MFTIITIGKEIFVKGKCTICAFLAKKGKHCHGDIENCMCECNFWFWYANDSKNLNEQQGGVLMHDWIFWLEFLAALIDSGFIVALLLAMLGAAHDSIDEEE